MNQRYILLSSVLVATTCMAQWAQRRPAVMDFRPATEQGTHPIVLPDEGEDRDGGDVVWQEDFANGLAGNNGAGAWTIEGTNGNVWTYSHTGPNGAYSTPEFGIIQSTTAANGFMKFASDSANTNWADTTIVSSPVDLEGSVVSPLIDLSATPYVQVRFQQRLRYCCGTAPNMLEVSTDGGSTWPFSYGVAGNWVANAQVVANTETHLVNITEAIAANPANVKIRFRHASEAGSSHYFWLVDDVQIVESYEYDLRVEETDFTYWDVVTSATYDSLPYTIYPYSQLRPIGLNMDLLNNGSVDQDVTANFTVERQGGPVVLDQDQDFMLTAGERMKLFVDPAFIPPTEAGTYNVSYSVTSANEDLVPADNAGEEHSFKVSEFIYARDGGTVVNFNDGDGAGGAFVIGNIFHVRETVDLYAVSVAFRRGTPQNPVDGTVVVGQLRTVDGDFSILEQTDEFVLENSMLNNTNGSTFTNLIFEPPVTLDPETPYYIAVEAYGYIRVGINGTSPAQTSFGYYDPVSPTQPEDWYYTTQTPMVRMNFSPTVGIEEADRSYGIGLGQNFPNPARQSTMVPYDLTVASPVSFEVRDLSGKLVVSRNEGMKAPGAYRTEFNTSNLTEGVYFYTLTAGDTRLTKRMTVIR